MLIRELRRWSPWEELSSSHRDIGDLFGRFFGNHEVMDGGWMPPMEVYRKEDNYVVRLDLPGVEAKEVEVHAEDNLLTIKGERKAEEKGPEYRETFYGRFERAVKLPLGVEADKIAARFENGVLEVSVPLPKALVGRTIPIQIEAGGKTIEHKAA